MKIKMLFFIGVVLLTIGLASALLGGRTLPTSLPDPDGRLISALPDTNSESNYNITNLVASLDAGNISLNNLYYKIIVPNDNDMQWNYSVEFAESKPYVQLIPVDNGDGTVSLTTKASRGFSYAWLIGNITLGDRLYTTDATTDPSLRGTLTNMYGINYKSRSMFCQNPDLTLRKCNDGFYFNYVVGASERPSVYNRRAALHLDGTQIAYAMETKNVSVAGVPELMKVFLI